jgi:hypothetical protein
MLNASFSNKTQLKNIFYFLFYWVRSGSMYFELSKIQKNLKKKKKMFLCIQPSVSKLKNHIVFFHTPKNNVLTCILALITSLLKSREHWPKFQKTTKILFCLSLSIRGMTLHVMRIPDI